jgi:hypothetical protein
MKVPTIHDLYKSARQDLLSREKEIVELKKDPLNAYIVHSKEIEASELRTLLSKFIQDIRDEKLEQLLK